MKIWNIAAEETSFSFQSDLGVEHDEGVHYSGAGDFIARVGDIEKEKPVAFVDSPAEEWVDGLRGRSVG